MEQLKLDFTKNIIATARLVVIDGAVKDPTVETFKEIGQEVEGSKKFPRSSNKEIKITNPKK